MLFVDAQRYQFAQRIAECCWSSLSSAEDDLICRVHRSVSRGNRGVDTTPYNSQAISMMIQEAPLSVTRWFNKVGRKNSTSGEVLKESERMLSKARKWYDSPAYLCAVCPPHLTSADAHTLLDLATILAIQALGTSPVCCDSCSIRPIFWLACIATCGAVWCGHE